MTRVISSAAAFNDLDLDTRLEVDWPGSTLHGKVFKSGCGPDGFISSCYILLWNEATGGDEVLDNEVFSAGCRFVVLN